jgi:hypothetical protein
VAGQVGKAAEKSVPEAHSYYLLTNHAGERSLRAQLFEYWLKTQVAENIMSMGLDSHHRA